MTEEEFSQEIGWFCKYYDNVGMNETKVKIWFELSKQYTQKEFFQALSEHIRTDEFPTFPAYGKIYQRLIKIKRPIQ